MLSTRSIFEEIRANDEAFRLLAGTASKNEPQGGRKSERVAELTRDPALAGGLSFLSLAVRSIPAATSHQRSVATLKRLAPGVATLTEYRREWLAGDVAAGFAIAAVSLPMALAYAAIVGVPAMAGLQSAILPLAVYALFGPSRRLVVGPDTAMCAVMAGVLVAMDLPEGAARLPAASALALVVGVACLAGGALGAGRAAGLLAKPVWSAFLPVWRRRCSGGRSHVLPACRSRRAACSAR